VPVVADAVAPLVMVGPVVGLAMLMVTRRGLVVAPGAGPLVPVPLATTVSVPVVQVLCV